VRAGVLVNDFGAINIDARLVVGVDGDTVSLALDQRPAPVASQAAFGNRSAAGHHLPGEGRRVPRRIAFAPDCFADGVKTIQHWRRRTMGALTPRSEIVMIASQAGSDSDALQHTFDGCIGTGDESQSPIFRLIRLLGEDTRGGNKTWKR